jgi:hypothetical protein
MKEVFNYYTTVFAFVVCGVYFHKEGFAHLVLVRKGVLAFSNELVLVPFFMTATFWLWLLAIGLLAFLITCSVMEFIGKLDSLDLRWMFTGYFALVWLVCAIKMAEPMDWLTLFSCLTIQLLMLFIAFKMFWSETIERK